MEISRERHFCSSLSGRASKLARLARLRLSLSSRLERLNTPAANFVIIRHFESTVNMRMVVWVYVAVLYAEAAYFWLHGQLTSMMQHQQITSIL